jgi:hypothetical protein
LPQDTPQPKLSDWGFGVTTCITAIVDRFWDKEDTESLIVAASDTRLSFGGLYASEGVVKYKPFHRDWSALIAGNDISQAIPVTERASELLRGKSGAANVVRREFKRAYQEHRREVMADIYLSSFDMTIPKFNLVGKRQMNRELHADFSFRIKNYDLGCTFMVYGFDDDGDPHIFTVSNPGSADPYDKPGFWAIGAGQTSAISMLTALRQHPSRSSLHETIYNVLAAKYTSEISWPRTVGQETWLFVHKRGCSVWAHKEGMETEVREIWENEGRPRTNSNAVKLIQEAGIEFLPIARGTRAFKRSELRKLKG